MSSGEAYVLAAVEAASDLDPTIGDKAGLEHDEVVGTIGLRHADGSGVPGW